MNPFKMMAFLLGVFLMPVVTAAENCLDMDACMTEAVRSAAEDTTIGELRRRCEACIESQRAESPPLDAERLSDEKPSPIDTRMKEEAETRQIGFALTTHRPNYVLPFVYNHSPNTSVYPGDLSEGDVDNTEVKFQVSLKYQLIDNIYKDNWHVYVAYTNLSYWQAYNSDYSSPFRDTNHEPEAWLQYDTDWELFWGIKSRMIQGGFSHQSNGRTEPFSRSWNRIFLNLVFEKENLAVSIKPWYRIPEDDEDDDNPDIDRYMGYGELNAAYKWGDNTFSLVFRNNLRSSGNKGAVELGWSFPLYKKLKGYVQYFNGYGQSILDYNDSANTIGVGLALSDIL
ncbi:phospholipase A [Desulfococcus sp.]|uniref:phospholipase A n=1 Tax=Desulfococcus sp. TaxID=2025834 RepID=UPI003D14B1AA